MPEKDLDETRWKEMHEECDRCMKGAGRVRPPSQRKIVQKLKMTKNGAELGRSRARNSQLEALNVYSS